MMTPWQVEFLGGLRISRDGLPPVCRLRTAKTTALLAFLCLHAGRDQGRDELADRFWPQASLESGRNSLRIALSALRRLLEPPDTSLPSEACLHATRSHIRLDSGAVECDVTRLETALRRGDRSGAAAIAAKGPFLPGVVDEWVYEERERIEALRFQALDEDLAGQKPAVTVSAPVPEAPPPGIPGRVPAPLGRFFGREHETAALVSLLADPTIRLITLVGPGGTGKTRLAIETARSLREGKATLPPGSVGGGVWFVPLVAATRSGHILSEISRQLGAPIDGNVDPLEALAQYLGSRRAGRIVLVLDNLEQIETEGCAETLLALLERVSEMVVLTTSRRRIGLPGERVVALAPFPLPERTDSLASLARHPAVALFVDRAREADIDFVLTPRHAAQIVELCVRLNGVPLALEMAASWAGVYTPGQMAEKVGDRSTESLPDRHAGRESRHRSLRAVAEWSIELLPQDARALLGALSVFQGRWTEQTALRVLGSAVTPERLALLRDHSLIASETSDGESGESHRNFHIMPSLRPFARELLLANPDIENEARLAHARFFAEMASANRCDLETWGDTVAALTFFEGKSDGLSDALAIVGSLWPFFWRDGQWEEGSEIIARVLAPVVSAKAMPDVSADALSDALRCAGKLAFYRRDFVGARNYMTHRLALETGRGRATEVIQLKANFAALDMEAGQFEEARATFEEMIPILPSLGPNWEDDCGYILNNYADVLVALSLNDAARVITESQLRGLSRRDRQGNGIAGLCWERMASIHLATGAYGEARTCAQTSLAIFRACGEIFRIADVLLLTARIAREDGDRVGALVALRESFELRRRVPSDDGFRRSIDEAELFLDFENGARGIRGTTGSTVAGGAAEAFSRASAQIDALEMKLK